MAKGKTAPPAGYLRAAKTRGQRVDGYCNYLVITSNEFEGMVKAGVLDPTKVVRTALQNAGSIASLMLTTEELVSELPEEKKAPAGGGMEGMY